MAVFVIKEVQLTVFHRECFQNQVFSLMDVQTPPIIVGNINNQSFFSKKDNYYMAKVDIRLTYFLLQLSHIFYYCIKIVIFLKLVVRSNCGNLSKILLVA